MFAYCGNKPVNRVDPYGTRSTNAIYVCYDDPAAEVGKLIGKLISEWLEEMTESDEEAIRSGEVSYVANKNGGAHIKNSHKVKTPWVMYEFIKENRGAEISGTTTGAVWEWCIHNIAYDVYTFLRDDKRVAQAKHVDLGSTIYNDNHGGVSYAMFASYFWVAPMQAFFDVVTYMWE